jgi:hypothetical protein
MQLPARRFVDVWTWVVLNTTAKCRFDWKRSDSKTGRELKAVVRMHRGETHWIRVRNRGRRTRSYNWNASDRSSCRWSRCRRYARIMEDNIRRRNHVAWRIDTRLWSYCEPQLWTRMRLLVTVEQLFPFRKKNWCFFCQ